MSKIPANTGVITIMRSDQLGAAQTAVQAIGVLDVWLAPFVILLFALAIYLARGFRRETLRNIGWAFVLVGITVLVLRRVGGNYVVNELVAAPNRPVMHDVWLTVTSILGSIGRGVVLYGIFAIVGAVLAGPHAGGHGGPALDGADAELPAGDGVGHRRLPLPAPGPVGPDARAAPARVDRHPRGHGRVRCLRAAERDAARVPRRAARRLRGEHPIHVGADRGEDAADTAAAELARLGEMRQQGLITDDEFAVAKARALA